MLLTTYVLLSAFGAAIWLLGHWFEFSGVATIGAVIVIAAGGSGMIADISVRDGEYINNEHTVVNNSTVVDNTTIQQTEREIALGQVYSPLTSFTLGGLTMLVGALLLIQHLNEVSLE